MGGDKDGHPGVNEKVLLDSLRLSRKKIHQIIHDYLMQIKKIILILKNQNLSQQFLKTDKLFRLLKNIGELPRAKARGLWTQFTLSPSGKASTA